MTWKEISKSLPDVYFDWYARLLPGVVGVISFYWLIEVEFELSSKNMFLHAVLAYVIGHVFQPFSGLIVKLIEWAMKSDRQKYAKAKVDPKQSSLVRKVSKAHAEANSMWSSASIIFVTMIYYDTWRNWGIVLVVYFVLSTVERCWARKTKISDIGDDG